jgi:hypothetical protein
MNFGKERNEEKFYSLENDVQASACPSQIKAVEEQPMYHNCASLCSLCEGKEGAKTIYISLVFMNYRNKTTMFLIIFLGLIATLTSVCDGCDVGTLKLKHFDWYKVCFTV